MTVYSVGADVVLSDLWWDCECDEADVGYGYIHPKTEPECPRCGMRDEDSPDSMANEVIQAGFIP